MTVEICTPRGELVERLDAEPRCGDFCDSCGDCLHCSHNTDYCDGRWVLYADTDAARVAELLSLLPPETPR